MGDPPLLFPTILYYRIDVFTADLASLCMESQMTTPLHGSRSRYAANPLVFRRCLAAMNMAAVEPGVLHRTTMVETDQAAVSAPLPPIFCREIGIGIYYGSWGHVIVSLGVAAPKTEQKVWLARKMF